MTGLIPLNSKFTLNIVTESPLSEVIDLTDDENKNSIPTEIEASAFAQASLINDRSCRPKFNFQSVK